MASTGKATREYLTVIVPCLNEEQQVGGTVESIFDVAQTIAMPVKVLLVDDGSTDGTLAKMKQLCETYDCEVMENPTNIGVGRSMIEAYKRIPGDSWVTSVSGDNEFRFESIHNFLSQRDQYDLILGYLQNPIIRPIKRRLASALYMGTVRALYGFPYRYINGMNLYRASVFHGIEIQAHGHAFNSELLAKAHLRNPLLRVGEAPFAMQGRTAGTSTAFKPRAVVKALGDVVRGRREVDRFRRQVLNIKD